MITSSPAAAGSGMLDSDVLPATVKASTLAIEAVDANAELSVATALQDFANNDAGAGDLSAEVCLGRQTRVLHDLILQPSTHLTKGDNGVLSQDGGVCGAFVREHKTAARVNSSPHAAVSSNFNGWRQPSNSVTREYNSQSGVPPMH